MPLRYSCVIGHRFFNVLTLPGIQHMNTRCLLIVAVAFLIGCQPSDKKIAGSSQGAAVETVPNLMDGVELKKVSDIGPHIKLAQGASIEKLAQAIADVDEWLFTAEDEKPAREMIEGEINRLRQRIETEIENLTKAALDAPNGKIAIEKMSNIGSLLALYPAPSTVQQRAKLAQITSSILTTSKRVEDIRHLRYNAWAISWIQAGLTGYRNALSVKSVFDLKKLVKTDKDRLIKNCVDTMSAIDTAYLDPATMDIYNYVLGLTRDALGSDDEARVNLAKGFANPKVIRRTPGDF